MDKRELNRTELSALLDGEIKDVAQLEELGRQVKADPELAAAFEEQREIKALLAGLPEHEAPDFLATRVMGEIADARNKRRPAALLRNLGLVATGFVLCLALVLTFTQFNGSEAPEQPELARDLALTGPMMDWSPPDDTSYVISPPIVGQDYDWQTVPHAEGVEDERIQEFLEFASRAHGYRVLVTKSEAASPDMADAILVLDQGSVK